MYRGTMLSARELEALRQITDVVRLGRVRRIEADRIVLERGETEIGADVLHVDCTALGLNNAPATPIFQPGRIVIQQIRHLSPSFNAALIGFVEGHRDDDAEKNRLCPPNPYASSIEDWPRMMSRTWRTEARWLNEPDVSAWVAGSRLNLLQALPDQAAEPSVQTALERYLTHLPAAMARLGQLNGSSSPNSTWAPGLASKQESADRPKVGARLLQRTRSSRALEARHPQLRKADQNRSIRPDRASPLNGVRFRLGRSRPLDRR